MGHTRLTHSVRRRSPEPSFNLSVMAWARTIPQPKGLARALLFELARCADEFGCSWYRQASIAQNIGCTSRTVRTHLGTLQALGLVRRIGRVGSHGGRISSVVHLIGWPDRKLIPRSGHPRLDYKVQEDKYAALERSRILAMAGKKDPEGAETPADQNNTNEINTTIEASMMRCLEALGPWATASNRAKLLRNSRTFEELLEAGFDLEAEFLPLLRSKAGSKAAIPTLVSWKYFQDALQAQRTDLAKPQNRPSRPKHHHAPENRDLSPQMTKQAGESSASFNDDVAALLRRSAKTHALKSDGQWL